MNTTNQPSLKPLFVQGEKVIVKAGVISVHTRRGTIVGQSKTRGRWVVLAELPDRNAAFEIADYNLIKNFK